MAIEKYIYIYRNELEALNFYDDNYTNFSSILKHQTHSFLSLIINGVHKLANDLGKSFLFNSIFTFVL